MPKANPLKSEARMERFGRVKEAREVLRAKAVEYLELYEKVIQSALDAEEYDVAAKHIQWLMEHMPEQDGERMFEGSVDQVKQIKEGATGPVINIGVAIGGVNDTKQLPAETLEAETVSE